MGRKTQRIRSQAEADGYLTVSQICGELKIKPGVLRKYCNNGLLSGMKYTRGGHRLFTKEQLEELRDLNALHNAGFTIPDLRKHVRLNRIGSAEAIAKQKAVFATKKRQLWQSLETLQKMIDFLERQEELAEQKMREDGKRRGVKNLFRALLRGLVLCCSLLDG